jgi:uncharacterized protein YbjT (DUF2867 family)
MGPTSPRRDVFITGGTGYLGRPLIESLLRRGHRVRALARPGSESKIPPGAGVISGDALHGLSYASGVAPADTFVHLVGVAHPSPAKAQEFLRVDLASVAAAVPAAMTGGVRHFVYVSVAHPAPAMHAYIAARTRGETLVRDSGLATTIIRPWYVLGPGHWWPVALFPGYWLASLVPGFRDTARRLALVTRTQMLRTLVFAVERPADGVRVLEVPQIRSMPPV